MRGLEQDLRRAVLRAKAEKAADLNLLAARVRRVSPVLLLVLGGCAWAAGYGAVAVYYLGVYWWLFMASKAFDVILCAVLRQASSAVNALRRRIAYQRKGLRRDPVLEAYRKRFAWDGRNGRAWNSSVSRATDEVLHELGESRVALTSYAVGELTPEAAACSSSTPCCDRCGEYNGFGSDGQFSFKCSAGCPCHD